MDVLFRIIGYFEKALRYHKDPSLRQYWALHRGLLISAVVAVVCLLYSWLEFSGVASKVQAGVRSIAHNSGTDVGVGLLGVSFLAVASLIYFAVKIALFDR